MMTEHDGLVERYLDGRMSPGEAAAFHHRVASDERLRRMLRAEQIIRGTVERDRRAIPHDHARTRTRALALVAATPAVPQAGPAATGWAWLHGMKGIVAAVAGTVIVAGSLVTLSGTGGEPAPVPGSSAPPAVAMPHPAAQPFPEPSATAPAVPTPATPEPSASSPAPRAGTAPVTPQRASHRPHPAEKPAVRAPEPPPEAFASETPREEAPQVIIRNDTLRTRVRIETLQRR